MMIDGLVFKVSKWMKVFRLLTNNYNMVAPKLIKTQSRTQ